MENILQAAYQWLLFAIKIKSTVRQNNLMLVDDMKAKIGRFLPFFCIFKVCYENLLISQNLNKH